MPDDATNLVPTDVFGPQTTTIRDTMKWLIGAFAAVGTVLLASVNFSDIGELDEKNFWTAVAWASGALLCVAAAIFMGTIVLSTSRPRLEEVKSDYKTKAEIEKCDVPMLSVYRDESGKKSIQKLSETYEAAIANLNNVEKRYADANLVSPDLENERNEAQSTLRTHDQAVQQVISYAHYVHTKRWFNSARMVAGIAALFTFVCLVGFVSIANKKDRKREEPPDNTSMSLPPKIVLESGSTPAAPEAIRVTETIFMTVTFQSDEALQAIEKSYKCKLPAKKFEALAIGGDLRHPLLIYTGSDQPCIFKADRDDVIVYPQQPKPMNKKGG